MQPELCEVVHCLEKAEGTRRNLSFKTYDTRCGNVGSAEAKLTYGGTAWGQLCCLWSLAFSSLVFACWSLHKQVEG